MKPPISSFIQRYYFKSLRYIQYYDGRKITHSLICVQFLFLVFPSQAQTPVYGTIVGQTWTAANSPYLVTDDIFVAGLTIEPGVEVIFQGDFVFEVGGILTAIGTPQDSILFTKADIIDGWQCIYFNFSNNASEMAYCRVENAVNSGIRFENSSPIIRNCSIADNSSTGPGGGIWTNSNLTLNCCSVKNNYSTGRFGGGIFNSGSLTLIDCEVIGNYNYWAGSSLWSAGGGIYSTGALIAEHSTISGNRVNSNDAGPFHSTSAYGGGIYLDADTLILEGCTINANLVEAHANTSSEVNNGGGIYTVNLQYGKERNTIVAHDSLFWRGAWAGSEAQGGGIYVYSGNLDIINSTIAYNEFEGVRQYGGTVSIKNSIVFFHSYSQIAGTTTTSYSNVQEGINGTGNISQNPLFNGINDLQIVPGSPCIDSGDPNSPYNDICFPPSFGDNRNDMGAQGGPGACIWNTIDCSTNQELVAEAGSTPTLCADDSVVIGGSPASFGGAPPYTYSWNPPEGLNSITISNPIASPNSTIWYTLTVTDSNGLTAIDSVQVIVNMPPETPTIQLIDENTLEATVFGDSYQWFLNDVPLPGNSQSIIAVDSGEYTVIITINGCDSKTSPPFIFEIVSTEGNNGIPAKFLRIFPNPSSGIINLEAEWDLPTVLNLAIIDVTGRMLKAWQSELSNGSLLSIDISAYPPGAYLLRIEYNGNTVHRKVFLSKN